MLLTLPVREIEIVFGKWLGAFSMYLLILGVSLVELAFTSPRRDWTAILLTYPALILTGAGLLAAGECISTLTKHQSAASAGTLSHTLAVFRILHTGLPDPLNLVVSGALLVMGLRASRSSLLASRSRAAAV